MPLARITPLNRQVLIIPDAKPKKTSSGIIIPVSAEMDRHIWGTVAAAGPDAHGIEKGDRIFFKVGHGTVVRIDGHTHWLVDSDPSKNLTLAVTRPE